MAAGLPDIVARIRLDTTELGDTSKATDKLGAGLKAGLAGVALAGAAALAVGFSDALNLDKANDKLAAQLGLTAGESEKAGKVAGGLFANAYGEDIGQVNEAVKRVVQDIGVDINSVDLQPLTAQVLDVSTAFDQELGGTTRAVASLLQNNLAPTAEAALDIITKGFQNGLDSSEDYLDTLNEYGPLFGRLGLDGQEATGLIQQGLQAGARDADTVADALKEFQIRATDGSTASAGAFELLGLNAEKFTAQIAKGGPEASAGLATVLERLRGIEDPVKRNTAAVGLFGTKAEDLGASLFALDPSTAVAGLGKVAGATDALGKTLNDNASTNITTFTRSLRSGFVDVLGNSVLPAVTDASRLLSSTFGPAVKDLGAVLGATVVPALKSLGDAVVFLSPVLLPLGAAVGVIAAAMAASAIATGIATAASGLYGAVTGGLAFVINSLRAAVLLLNLAFAANPIGLVLVLLLALAAALFVAFKRSEGFREAVTGAFEAVRDVVVNVLTAVGEFIVRTFDQAKRIFSTALDAIQSNVSGAFSAVRATVSSVLSAVGSAISSAWSTIRSIFTSALSAVQAVVSFYFNGYRALIGAVLSAISAVVTTALGVVQAIFTTVLGVVRTVVTGGLEAVRTIFTTVLNGVLTVVRTVLTGAQVVFTTVLGAIRAVVQTALAAVQAVFSTVFGAIRGVITAGLTAAQSAVTGALSAIRGAITSGLSAVDNLFGDAFRAAANAVRGAIGGITGVVRTIPGAITGALGNVGSLLVNAGRELMEGLARGIGETINRVVGKVRDAVALIGRLLPGSPVKDGPLRSWNRGGAGKRLMGMLADGVEAGAPNLQRTLSGVLANLPDVNAGALAASGLSLAGGGRRAGSAAQAAAAGATYNLELNGVDLSRDPGDTVVGALRRMELLTA